MSNEGNVDRRFTPEEEEILRQTRADQQLQEVLPFQDALKVRGQLHGQLLERLIAKIRCPEVGNTQLNLNVIQNDLAAGKLPEGIYQPFGNNCHVIIAPEGIFVLDYSGYSSSEVEACAVFAKRMTGRELPCHRKQLSPKYWDINRVEDTRTVEERRKSFERIDALLNGIGKKQS